MSFTVTVVLADLKNIPINLFLVPVIFPPIKTLFVFTLYAIIPFASSPFRLISPVFLSSVFVFAPSLVVYIPIPEAPIFILPPLVISVPFPTIPIVPVPEVVIIFPLLVIAALCPPPTALAIIPIAPFPPNSIFPLGLNKDNSWSAVEVLS